MKIWTRIRQMALFTVIGFGPVILIGGILLLGILLNLSIMTVDSSLSEPADVLSFVSFAVILSVLLITVPVLAFLLFNKTKNWIQGSFILYGAWLFLAGILSYQVFGSIAGASMAVVDGGVNAVTLKSAIMQQTTSFMLYGHVVIVPWAFATGWIFTHDPLARLIRDA